MASKVGLTLCIGGLALVTGAAVTQAQARDASAAAAPPTARGVVAPRLEITAIAAVEAEDGRGGRVAAPRAPRALDLHASSWPGRALDPVLHVGALRFRHYSFPAKGVMRFVVDDVARLRDGDEVALQWGDDASTRVVLTRSLEVPR